MAHPSTAPRPPGTGGRMIWLGALFAAGFWVLEELIHVLALHHEGVQLIPHDPHELWMRSLVMALIFAFGVYAHVALMRLRRSESERQALRAELEAALTKVLSGFIPICAQCKKIRDAQGNWIRIERYIEDRTEADFTHGFCGECLKLLYSDVGRPRGEQA